MSRKLLVISPTIDQRWLSELFHYGKFTFGTNVSSMIVKNIDSWMLGRMISAESVATFNPAIRVSNLVEVPADTLSFIYFPHLSKKISSAENDQVHTVKYFYEKAVATVMAVMIPIVVTTILFADEIVHVIAGRGFEETVPILKVTMLFGLLIPFNRFLGITLDAIGKAALNFKMVLAMAAMNALSNILFIQRMGTIGAAYGTLTTYLIMVSCNQIFLHRRFGVSLFAIGRLTLKMYKEFFSQFGFRVQSPLEN
jgi:O-antigen/teichoic acid export membrane protein